MVVLLGLPVYWNSFHQAWKQPKIVRLNGTPLESLVCLRPVLPTVNPPHTITTLSIQTTCVIVSILCLNRMWLLLSLMNTNKLTQTNDITKVVSVDYHTTQWSREWEFEWHLWNHFCFLFPPSKICNETLHYYTLTLTAIFECSEV